MSMVEEAALDALGRLILTLWENFQQELSVTSKAKLEKEDLQRWEAAIHDCLKEARSVEVPSETLKAGIDEMQEFLSASESAINDYMRFAREGNCILACIRNHFNSRNFTNKAKDAKRKLTTCLTTLKTVVDAKQTLHQLQDGHAQARLAGYRSSSIAYSEEKHEVLVGIEEPVEQLFQLLTEDGDSSKSKVIFVHGTQGVGKTSLVGAVLRDERVSTHFKYYVWIKDLRSCESAEDINRALMDADTKIWDLNKNNDQGEQVKLTEAFKRMGKDGNNRSRWVLVLDDASRSDVFKSLKNHFYETRPIVLVTTCISNLASLSESRAGPSDERYVFHEFKHAVLSADDSHNLFCQKMPRKYECASKPRVHFDSILEKCGRLPLAILAMCEHLIHELGGGNSPQFDEWKKWSGSLLFSSLSNYEENSSTRRIITKCMDRFQDVQDCVLYLSIFPLDCPLRYSTLMRLWKAEFSKEEFSTGALKKLVDHNFFQEVKRTSYGKVGTCHVNNLLHQMIISQSINDRFSMIVAGQEGEWPYTIRRLSFHSTPKSEVEGRRVKELISLHIVKEMTPKSMKKLLGYVEKLKVLDLQRHLTKVEKDRSRGSLTFPQEILHLKCLIYLSLRDTKVKKIPDGIGDLEYLETLDLKGTAVSELPDNISKLKRLRHLLVYRSNRHLIAGIDPKHGVKAPPKLKLGDLNLLQKLCMIELDPVKQSKRRRKNKTRRSLLKEIEKLTDLRRLGISTLRNTDVELLCSSIGRMENLEALRLIAAPEEKIDLSFEDLRKIPKTLKRVHLIGCFRKSPNQILSYTGVVKLVLKGSQLNGDPLQHLQKLHNLKHLELQQAFDVTERAMAPATAKLDGHEDCISTSLMECIIIQNGWNRRLYGRNSLSVCFARWVLQQVWNAFLYIFCGCILQLFRIKMSSSWRTYV
ncbi:hypothetical protein BT93_L5687 [Corymbia citriodora subsp. variegata]|uniref:Uncharacterized protein n=1 Tax=Corymbia citriodora subsp. variegata TaxID=360336 RepID=A0A8T0CRM4_CORYI|nr:hypothetical protein BT93_L5687 [Corymbia citriodora subsp. variegata]